MASIGHEEEEVEVVPLETPVIEPVTTPTKAPEKEPVPA